MRIHRVAFLAVLFLAAGHAMAQGTPSRDPQAIAVLQRAVTVMGGPAVQQSGDTVMQVTVSDPSGGGTPTTTSTIKTKGATMLRWDADGPSGRTSVVLNGGRLWRQRDGQWQRGPSANARHRRPDHLPALALAYELQRADYEATYVGTETIDGQLTYHIRLARHSSRGDEFDQKNTKDSELNVFIDAQTFVVVKLSYIWLSDTDWRRGLPMEVYYADYRVVQGLAVPFRQRYVFNGRAISESRVTSFAINVGVSDADFEGR